MKIEALKQALDLYRFNVVFGVMKKNLGLRNGFSRFVLRGIVGTPKGNGLNYGIYTTPILGRARIYASSLFPTGLRWIYDNTSSGSGYRSFPYILRRSGQWPCAKEPGSWWTMPGGLLSRGITPDAHGPISDFGMLSVIWCHRKRGCDPRRNYRRDFSSTSI